MASGMEMMVNALMKAAGFERAQLDNAMELGKAKAAEFEARFSNIEKNIGEILALLKKERNDNAADDVGGNGVDGQ